MTDDELLDKIKAADPCMDSAIDEIKKAHPEYAHAQVIAVAMSKCGGKAMAEPAADNEPDADPDDPCIQGHMDKLMADGSMSKPDAMKKAMSLCAEGGKAKLDTQARADLKDSDFVDATNRAFPITDAASVMDAIHSWGRYKGPMTFDEFKKRLTAIAKRKGFASSLPADWKAKAFEVRLKDGLKALGLLKEEVDEATAFKVAGNHWVATWSNNLEDRDGEIFTAKAIDDFVARVDMGIVPPPELWVWHVPGTRIGQAEWVDRHGHFLMAMGTFDATPAGEKARAYYQKHAGNKSLSHGFTFPTNQFDGKHYHQFNTFEISLLPRGAEANLYTSLEGVKAMAKVISEAKKAELFAAFGEEIGARILAAEDAKGKALDELGIASKDFVPSTDSAAAANQEAVAAANKAFTALVPELMEGSAEAVIAANEAVTKVKAFEQRLMAAEASVDAMREELKLRPRASVSSKTLVKDDDPLAKASQIGLTKEQESLSEALPGLFKQG